MKTIWLRVLALVCLLSLLLTTLIACESAEEDGEGLPENMQHATVAGSDYRLYLPIDWNNLTSIGISGGYASQINMAMLYVKVYDNPDALSLEEYLNSVYLPTLQAVFPGQTAFSSEQPTSAKLGGEEALALAYTGTRETIEYKGIETACAKGTKVYVLSFCARADIYESYLSVRSEVVDKFIFSSTPYVPDAPINTVDPNATAPEGMQLASNDTVAYRFYVPNTWVLDPNITGSSAYVSESNRTNVNVTTITPEKNYATPADYWKEHLTELSAYLTIDQASLTYTDTTIADITASTCEYTADVNGTTLRFAQTIVAHKGILYTVTMTAQPEHYDAHKADYQSILEHFSFR